jgi:hypothetical protein
MPFTSLYGLQFSSIQKNAEAFAKSEGWPLLPSDYAAWRAVERYGVHTDWPYIATLACNYALHPAFIKSLKEPWRDCKALQDDLRMDVLDAVCDNPSSIMNEA